MYTQRQGLQINGGAYFRWSFATSHLEPYLSWVSLGIIFEWDDYSNLGRDRTRSQKEKEAGECKKYC